MLGFLSGTVVPIFIIISGTILSFKCNIFKILNPRSFFNCLKGTSDGDGISQTKALCTALAGTLGVGNIAGVSSAVSCGGAGAIFWMWVGAVFSLSIKYSEVFLAVEYRLYDGNGYFGGTMFTMRYGMRKHIGKFSVILGGIFSALCIVNSLVTGNAVQVYSAASVFSDIPRPVIGIILGIITLTVSLGGSRKIMNVTYSLIPMLSGIYILFSVVIIFSNITVIPRILHNIIHDAFSFKSATGGFLGISVNSSIRYGITRGIFSNEAGCGTSPSAHAAAYSATPHSQGVLGIFEVIADTLILCTMTAFVILLGKQYGIDAVGDIPLVLSCFSALIGKIPAMLIAVSIILFALATLLAQQVYIKTALLYFTKSDKAYIVLCFLSFATSVFGSSTSNSFIWYVADFTVCIMTVINLIVILTMSAEIRRRKNGL